MGGPPNGTLTVAAVSAFALLLRRVVFSPSGQGRRWKQPLTKRGFDLFAAVSICRRRADEDAHPVVLLRARLLGRLLLDGGGTTTACVLLLRPRVAGCCQVWREGGWGGGQLEAKGGG